MEQTGTGPDAGSDLQGSQQNGTETKKDLGGQLTESGAKNQETDNKELDDHLAQQDNCLVGRFGGIVVFFE